MGKGFCRKGGLQFYRDQSVCSCVVSRGILFFGLWRILGVCRGILFFAGLEFRFGSVILNCGRLHPLGVLAVSVLFYEISAFCLYHLEGWHLHVLYVGQNGLGKEILMLLTW